MSGDDSGYVKVHQPETTTTRRRACACYPACVLRVCSPLCQSLIAELVLSVGIACARAPTRVCARARACKGGVCGDSGACGRCNKASQHYRNACMRLDVHMSRSRRMPPHVVRESGVEHPLRTPSVPFRTRSVPLSYPFSTPCVPLQLQYPFRTPSVPFRTPSVPFAYPFSFSTPFVPLQYPFVPLQYPFVPLQYPLRTPSASVPLQYPFSTPFVPLQYPFRTPSVPFAYPFSTLSYPFSTLCVPLQYPLRTPLRTPFVPLSYPFSTLCVPLQYPLRTP